MSNNNSKKNSPTILFLTLSLHWIVPGHIEPLAFQSSAIGVVTLFAIATLWLLCFALPWREARPSRAPYGLALLATFLLVINMAFSDASGLVARYYDNATFSGNFEKSLPVQSSEYTRSEPMINFGHRGFAFNEQYFLLAFANDTHRRDWRPDIDTSVDNYSFSIELNGYITIPSSVTQLRLASHAGIAELFVDGIRAASTTMTVSEGTHAITVRYVRNQNEKPGLRLLWSKGNTEDVVPSTAFSTTVDGSAPAKPWLTYIALLLWLFAAGTAIRETRPKLELNIRTAAWMIYSVLLLIFCLNIYKASKKLSFQIFRVGNDWLQYETLARAIMQGDWLSRSEGNLIFLNFGYRYLLALMHSLGGESIGNAVLLQCAVMSACAAFAIHAVYQLYGKRAASVMLLLTLLCKPFLKFALPLLDTTFGIALSFGALYCLIQYRRSPRRNYIFAASILLGLACLIRANFLPFIFAASLWLFFFDRHSPRPALKTDIGIFVCGALAIFLTIGLRNYLVSDQWVFMPTNGLPNLWVGNHPPEFDGPTYFTAKQIPSHEIVPRVLEYWRAEPVALAQRVWGKVLYIVGIDREQRFQAEIGLPWIIAIIGSIQLWRQRALRSELVLLWLWIGIVNAPLLILFPWGYGWRLSAPSYLPLYTICSLSIAYWSKGLFARFKPRTRRKSENRILNSAHRTKTVLR